MSRSKCLLSFLFMTLSLLDISQCYPLCQSTSPVWTSQSCYCREDSHGNATVVVIMECDLSMVQSQPHLLIGYIDSDNLSSHFKIQNRENFTASKNFSDGNRVYSLIRLVIWDVPFTDMNPLIDNITQQGYKVEDLSLRYMNELELQKFNRTIHRMAKSLSSLEVEFSFENCPSETVDLSAFKFEKLRLRNNKISFRLSDTVWVGTQFDISNELKNTELNLYINHSAEVSEFNIAWSTGFMTNEDRFYPRIFSSSWESAKPVNVEFNDNPEAKLFEKETLMYAGKINRLCLPSNLERIEYGSLANGYQIAAANLGIMRGVVCNTTFIDESARANWLDGKCWNLNLELCKLCMMHEYGLEKTDDNVPQICTGQQKFKGDRNKCYWSLVKSPPKSLRKVPLAYPLIDIKAKKGILCQPKDYKILRGIKDLLLSAVAKIPTAKFPLIKIHKQKKKADLDEYLSQNIEDLKNSTSSHVLSIVMLLVPLMTGLFSV